MKTIELTQGYFATVDDEDFDLLNKYRWKISINKKSNNIYAIRNYKSNNKWLSYRMHRVILDLTESKNQVDHIDGNGLNNCKSNLRLATNSQNQYNKRGNRNSSSEYKGVNWHKASNGWAAQIQFNKKKIWIGTYKTEKEAAIAYNKKAKELFGEFAHLNKIEENK